MSDLERYAMAYNVENFNFEGVEPSEHGDFVFYKDAQARINELETESEWRREKMIEWRDTANKLQAELAEANVSIDKYINQRWK